MPPDQLSPCSAWTPERYDFLYSEKKLEPSAMKARAPKMNEMTA